MPIEWDESRSVGKFSDFLSGWLVDHIKTDDMAYRPHVKGRSDARKAMESFSFVDHTANASAAKEDDGPER
jgi:hemerythrin